MLSVVRRTPVLRSASVTAHLGDVVLKLENLQRTGSFKLRGAVEALRRLGDGAAAGVVTSSAGNHGAGLSLAAQATGVPLTVYVPEGTPEVKRARIAATGATVVVEGAGYDDAEARARARAAADGLAFISPYDDDAVIEGNGRRLADEILEQVADAASIVVPVGGGGLIGGLAERAAPRGVEVWGVQPAANCAMAESLRLGRALTTYEGEPTCAEGCEGATAERTFELVRAHAAGVVTVSEEAILDAVAFLYRAAGQIAECSAAVAVAGVATGAVTPRTPAVVVITGGNIDPSRLDAILAER